MIYQALLHLTLLSTDLLGLNNMSRVTPEEVKEIITTDLGDPVVQVWIDVANSIVNDNADCIGSDETKLTMVELQLSAHFISMLDPAEGGIISSESIDTFKTSYKTADIKEQINTTTYGMAANMISGGCLASTSNKAVKLFALG